MKLCGLLEVHVDFAKSTLTYWPGATKLCGLAARKHMQETYRLLYVMGVMEQLLSGRKSTHLYWPGPCNCVDLSKSTVTYWPGATKLCGLEARKHMEKTYRLLCVMGVMEQHLMPHFGLIGPVFILVDISTKQQLS